MDDNVLSSEEMEELLASARGQLILSHVDVPVVFRFEARTGVLEISTWNVPLADGTMMGTKLILTGRVTEALLALADAIRANPERDIEGSAVEPNEQ